VSSPVDTDDLIAGATKFLQAQAGVLAVLGTTADGTPLLFQHDLYVVMEGTSSTAAVLAYGGGWSGANPHNTLRFPRLSLQLWADPVRDDGHNPVRPGEVQRRIHAAFGVFDRLLHRPAGGEQWWGTVRTLSSVRSAEPSIYPVPDGNGLLRAQAFYAIEQG
jgi:hypothetical protein